MRRRALGKVSLVLVGSCFALAGAAPTSPPALDLALYVDTFVHQLPGRGSQALILPSDSEARAFNAVLAGLRDGELTAASRHARPLGYSVHVVRDRQDGRRLAIVAETSFEPATYKGWGLYVVALEDSSRLSVEVTHPVHDVHTPHMGVEAFRLGKGALLAVAGTHRYANEDGSSDTAHVPSTMLARVDQAWTGRDTIVLQPHGFDAANFPDYGDMVVSDGEAPPSSAVVAVREALEMEGFDACLYDGLACAGLAATTNVQGAAARDNGADFVHLEVSRGVRDDPTARSLVIRATVRALLGPG